MTLKRVIKKYDLNDFIITIIYKNNDKLTVLSKIQLNQSFKVDNKKFERIDLSKERDLNLILVNLKTYQETHYKLFYNKYFDY